MERTTSINEAKIIFGHNFIGPEELAMIAKKMGVVVPLDIPLIDFDIKYLKERCGDYLLVLGLASLDNGESITLKSLREKFGSDPDIFEPCFYNQDWYLNEDFINKELECRWFLIRKTIFNNSRAKLPEILVKEHSFPSAILCAYVFFIFWFCHNEVLWKDDFVWCDDVDRNGDRIYVGRYLDLSGGNRKGFNIHRHLSIRDNYGSVEVL